MLAFLDTEFTSLVIQPRLLSVGLVVQGAAQREFYAEVTDPERLQATGRYGQGAVLPQFGKIAGAACRHADLGSRLASFLDGLARELRDDDVLRIAYGHALDWDLIDLAIRESGSATWDATRRRIRPLNVYALTGFGAGQVAAEAYFTDQAGAPFSRHHALCDARALRLAYEAVVPTSVGADPVAA